MRAFLVCLLLSGCSTTEVTLLVGSRQSNNGETYSSPAAELVISQRIGRRGICSYSHTSDPSAGKPFNDDFDISHDFAGCGVRWGASR